jgi:pimeloyl-ACP methyl ester carboxylesterase
MTIPEFSYDRIRVGDVHLGVAQGGAGPPVVLLHGFPQTHLAWRQVAVSLARDHRVICPDLRGYGGSDKPPGDYSKRQLAADVVALARALGHERFALAGHDRGALVAFRAALDHPAAVGHLAVLDVIPAVDLWASLRGTDGVFAFHLFLLAHPPPLMPVAALWQRPAGALPFDPAAVWGSWAPDLRTHVLDCGHFLPEERPEEVVAALGGLLAA